eukprot:COSAG01_NODE_814_length_13398_cov_4.254230_5_plen_309_part_00
MRKLNIAVSSTSFSKNQTLKSALKEKHNICRFNEIDLDEADLIGFIADADTLLVGKEGITNKVLAACPALNYIVKYGVGLDNIDFSACKKYGVQVIFKQGVNALSVAEMTLGFMLTLSHSMLQQQNKLKKQNWEKHGGWQLSEKIIGVIGVGHVGKKLISLLKPFNTKILVNDIIDQTGYYNEVAVTEVDKAYLYKHADIVTIHTPLTEQTQRLINKQVLAQMQSHAYLINTARGGIVNQVDLYEALITKQIAGVALDVYEQEPSQDHDLLALDQVFCTPHIGGNSLEAVLNMGYAAISGLDEILLQS